MSATSAMIRSSWTSAAAPPRCPAASSRPCLPRPCQRRLATATRASATPDGGGLEDSANDFSSLRKNWRPQAKKADWATGAAAKGFGAGAAGAKAKGTKGSRKQDQGDQEEDLGKMFGNRVVLGNDLSEESWRAIDAKVNKYPCERTFTAIGTGGEEFRDAIVARLEAVVGPIHKECVSQRPSAQGKYLSVKMSVVVTSPDQVLEVYQTLKAEPRVKWCM